MKYIEINIETEAGGIEPVSYTHLYKRRVEKEKSDIYAYANEKLVSQLLDVIDNFERALLHEETDDSYVEGMKMIFKQLTGVLEKAGLEEIDVYKRQLHGQEQLHR